MAKKKGAQIMFEAPDDLPEDEPQTPAAGPGGKEEEPELEAPAEEPEQPAATEAAEDDLPGSDEPDDPYYHATVARQEAAELRRRLAEVEERTRERPEDREAAKDQQLLAQRRALRERVMAAQKGEDSVAYQAAKWELDDLEDEIRSRATERQLRQISGGDRRQPERPAPVGGGDDLVQSFIRANKVTPSELGRIKRDWAGFIQKNPAWSSPHINPWQLMTRQLKLVRTDKPAAAGASAPAAVESGARTSGGGPSSGSSGKTAFDRANPAEQIKIAAAFGMTPDQYRRRKQQQAKKGAK